MTRTKGIVPGSGSAEGHELPVCVKVLEGIEQVVCKKKLSKHLV